MNAPDFGRFTILHALGRGGMAEVFKCRLTGIGGFDKIVVVKRILPDLAEDPEFVRMLLDEARIAANFNHSNVVQIFEIDQVDGVPYIAMEYVEGLTLGKLSRLARKLRIESYGNIAKIFSGVCAGLQYVHAATDGAGQPLNLVHRDISPQNILVSREGVPKILDFGVAKAQGRLVSTQAGTLKGKLKYMAPEQVRPDAVEIDARADVFSLGVCLYEATTGQSPYGNQQLGEVSLIQKIVEGQIVPPSQLVPNYPKELEEIVLSAMAYEREQRCDASDMHDRLESFCSSGEYGASRRSLTAWVGQLMVAAEEASALSGAARLSSAPAPGSGSKPKSSGGQAPQGSRQFNVSRQSDAAGSPSADDNMVEIDVSAARSSGSKRALWIVAGLAGAALLVAGTWWARAPSPDAKPLDRQGAAAVSAPASDKALPPDTNAAAEAFLQEAERYSAHSRFGPALQLIQKARDLNITDPILVIRLTDLQDRIERDALLLKANTHMREKEYAKAVDVAKQVLDHDPENAKAFQIISEARTVLFPAKAAEAKRPPPPPVKGRKSAAPLRDGMLTVLSTPQSMVYLDDEPLGPTPVQNHSVSPGSHFIQLRRNGYVPAEADINIQSGKDFSYSMTLVKEGVVSAPPAPVESEPVATPTPKPSPAPTPAATPAPVVASVKPPDPAPPAAPASATSESVPKKPPTGSVPVPKLPQAYLARSTQDVDRAFGVIENETVASGFVSKDFAGKALAPLKNELRSQGSGASILPGAIYYFLIREAVLGHSPEASAEALKTSHRAGMGGFSKLRVLSQTL